MVKSIFTIAWSEFAMSTLFVNLPNMDRVQTFDIPVENGAWMADCVPHWIEKGWVETFRAETLILN